MSNPQVSSYLELDDAQFAELVTEHVHPQTGDPQVWDVLLCEELIDRTSACLNDMLQRNERAMNKKRNRLDEAKAESLRMGYRGKAALAPLEQEHTAWRRRAVNFKKMVEFRRQQIGVADRQYRTERHKALTADSTYVLRDALRRMAIRIHEHQACTASSGRDAEQYDYDLWRLLDEITVPVGEGQKQTTLRSMLRTFWFDTAPATREEGEMGEVERLMKRAPGGRSPNFEGRPKVRHPHNPVRLVGGDS